MSMSLREQLLAAGLGNKQQAKKAEQEERQRVRNKTSQDAKAKEQQRLAQAQAAKAARDLELNRKREEQAARKALWAEIKQLIEQHKLPKPESDEYFNFIDREKVRRMPVDATLRVKLMNGELAIVRCEGRYDIVPPEIANRIGDREPRAVVSLKRGEPEPAADDPYKDYVVPDDLMW
jgi:uncharacterized protein YaiL (DUF2058 family)